jgi:hypothetical protein
MKMIEGFKKFVAALTVFSMVFVLVPQSTYAAAPTKPVATPVGGLSKVYSSVQVNLSANPGSFGDTVCIAYSVDSLFGSYSAYNGSPITIEGANDTLKTLYAFSFKPRAGTTCQDKNYKLSDRNYDLLTEVYFFDTKAPEVFLSGTISNGYYTSDVVVNYTDKRYQGKLAEFETNPTAILDDTLNVTNNLTHQVTISGEGKHKIAVKDAAGNETVKTFTIDKTKPTVILSESNIELERGSAFNALDYVTTSDAAGTPVSVAVSGVVNVNAVDEYFTIVFTGADGAGNVSDPATLVVHVRDTQAPKVWAGNNEVVNETVLHEGTATDGAFALDKVLWEQIKFVGDPTLPNGTATMSPVNTLTTNMSADIDGIYSIKLKAWDMADNKNSDVMKLVWDTKGPVIGLDSKFVTNQEIKLSPTVDEPEWGSGVDHDGYKWTIIDSPTGSKPKLSNKFDRNTKFETDVDGEYTLKFRAKDKAGNKTVVEATIKWDTSVPVIKLLGADDITVGVGSTYIDPGATVTDPDDTLSVTGVVPLNMTDKVGDYEVLFNVWDEAGNQADQVVRTVHVVEQAVTGLSAVSGNGFVDLSWFNPSDADFAGALLYRSTVQGEIGSQIGDLVSPINTFRDSSVINGTRYFYSLRSYDVTGPEGSEVRLGFTSAQVEGAPNAPVVLAVNRVITQNTFFGQDQGIGEQAPEVKGATKEKGEVKSGQTDENKDKSGDNKSIPAFGIAILLLLLLFGLYLIYQQKPEWFAWMMFWKKK